MLHLEKMLESITRRLFRISPYKIVQESFDIEK